MVSRSSRPVRSKNGRKIFHYVAYMIAFFAVLLFYVYQHVQAIRYGYVVEEKRKEESLLRKENDRIIMEIREQTSLQRLEQLAESKLGLKIASKQEIIVMPIPQQGEENTSSLFDKALKRFKSAL